MHLFEQSRLAGAFQPFLSDADRGMQSNVRRELNPHYARFVYSGPIAPEVVKVLVELIDESFSYYMYQVVQLDIESPGGSLLALQFLMDRMRKWAAEGKVIRTSSSMSVASAAALMLTLGTLGQRQIDSFTLLTYHFSRVSPGTITAMNAGQLKERLEIEDARILDRVIQHVLNRQAWKDWRTRMLARIEMSLKLVAHARSDTRHAKIRLQRLKRELSAAKDLQALEGKYRQWLVRLFAEDRPIENLEAWCLNLVDEVHGLTSFDQSLGPAGIPAPATRASLKPMRMGACQ